MSEPGDNKKDGRFNRQFDSLERDTPRFIGRALHFLRRPWAMLIRIPLGIVFVFGGIFSFLPVLGLWMLPVGLLLLAVDIPFLRGPVGSTIIRLRRWWENRRRNRRDRD